MGFFCTRNMEDNRNAKFLEQVAIKTAFPFRLEINMKGLTYIWMNIEHENLFEVKSYYCR